LVFQCAGATQIIEFEGNNVLISCGTSEIQRKTNAHGDYKYKIQEGVYYTVSVADIAKALLLRLYKAGS
jgi:hypothetical protein